MPPSDPRREEVLQRLAAMGREMMFGAPSVGSPIGTFQRLNSEPVDEICRIALNSERENWSENFVSAQYVAEAKRQNLSIDDCRVAIGLPKLERPPPPAEPVPTPRRALCRNALDAAGEDWDTRSYYADDVAEAKRRDLSIDDCRVALGLPKLERAAPLPVTAYRPPSTDMPEPNAGSELNAQEVYRVDAPSIYLVIAASSLPVEGDQSASLGTAVAINEHLALTNCHIIGANTYVAMFDDAENRLGATVWARDSNGDRCILQTDETLRPIRGARRSETIDIGERVYTIGNPEGLRSSLAEGIVSGVREKDGVRYIQTTAPISQGSSGGALVDSRGNLLGITTFFAQDAQNLNFAIAAEVFWAGSPPVTSVTTDLCRRALDAGLGGWDTGRYLRQ